MRRTLAGIGKALITLGLLILLFVAYQLWGTGVYTARAQNQLESQFEKSLAQAGTDDPIVTPPSTARSPVPAPPTQTTTAPPPPSVPEGDALAHLVIPKIGLDTYVVEGVGDGDLRKGPGHYPVTSLPGQLGNAAIAGHRTTYGAPFGELDSLEPGDTIEITTLQGTYEYLIYNKIIVSPEANEVLLPDPTRSATLTLTTCHPQYSAAQRLIIQASLVLPPGAQANPSSAKVVETGQALDALGNSLSGDSGSTTPTVLAGLLTALLGALWWLLFHRHPRWTTWIVGAIPFGISLFALYYLVERALPSNY